MKVGLLWFDDSTRSLSQKVALAAAAFFRKHGGKVVPNVCYVHASALGDGGCEVPGIEVRPGIPGSRPVLRCHFWVGREERRSEKLLQGGD